ncbi:MAG: hypothetical protein J5520_03550 [Bacteroidales bacterium]|nr:hypothetical protein [Bacteroidales bacterium]
MKVIVKTGLPEHIIHLVKEERPTTHLLPIDRTLVADDVIYILKDPHLGLALADHPHKCLEEVAATLIFPTFQFPGERPRLAAYSANKKVNLSLILGGVKSPDIIIPPVFSDRIVGEIGLLRRLINVTSENNLVLDTKPLKSLFRGATP